VKNQKTLKNNHILISRKKLEYIAHNLVITTHARKRLQQRCKNKNLKTLILNSPLWWRNTDGSTNIATDNYHYIVVAEVDKVFKVITYQGKSINGYSVIDKFILAYAGLERNKNKVNFKEHFENGKK
jgi:hypothetical protein